MKIAIARAECIGTGQCVLSASEVFDRRDADGVAELLDDARTATS
ncbi:ferredoxin [Haloactinomyces albus]|uniref:Ferredoxin n=1 Tax=Haloactinomyces albus TaxID=1352928 RepID=A0AAE3ZGQ9_9ACTN|nr:ferredoxin [Haloactinomyces albus]MDR7304626.1 ferredoxin [Haloactinomyces albus]